MRDALIKGRPCQISAKILLETMSHACNVIRIVMIKGQHDYDTAVAFNTLFL